MTLGCILQLKMDPYDQLIGKNFEWRFFLFYNIVLVILPCGSSINYVTHSSFSWQRRSSICLKRSCIRLLFINFVFVSDWPRKVPYALDIPNFQSGITYTWTTRWKSGCSSSRLYTQKWYFLRFNSSTKQNRCLLCITIKSKKISFLWVQRRRGAPTLFSFDWELFNYILMLKLGTKWALLVSARKSKECWWDKSG